MIAYAYSLPLFFVSLILIQPLHSMQTPAAKNPLECPPPLASRGQSDNKNTKSVAIVASPENQFETPFNPPYSRLLTLAKNEKNPREGILGSKVAYGPRKPMYWQAPIPSKEEINRSKLLHKACSIVTPPDIKFELVEKLLAAGGDAMKKNQFGQFPIDVLFDCLDLEYIDDENDEENPLKNTLMEKFRFAGLCINIAEILLKHMKPAFNTRNSAYIKKIKEAESFIAKFLLDGPVGPSC